MQQTNDMAATQRMESQPSANWGSTVTPELIQQLLDHDYLKLKIKAQVEEITTAKLRRWRAGLLGAASAAVAILGYLGIQANQVITDFNNRAEKVHALQDEIVAAQGKVDSASTRVADLIAEAKDNAQRSTALVSSSQDFLRDNIKQVSTVNQVADSLNRKLTEDETRLQGIIADSQRNLEESAKEVNATLKDVKPYMPAMKAASTAAVEARKAGTFELVFLESNSDRAIVLSDYKDQRKKYRLRFITSKIRARASLDVESTDMDGRANPVLHLANLTPGEIRAIENTPFQVEVSALRHHSQPFLHSFLILRVMPMELSGASGATRAALTEPE